jgi:hypothetical protein
VLAVAGLAEDERRLLVVSRSQAARIVLTEALVPRIELEEGRLKFWGRS